MITEQTRGGDIKRELVAVSRVVLASASSTLVQSYPLLNFIIFCCAESTFRFQNEVHRCRHHSFCSQCYGKISGSCSCWHWVRVSSFHLFQVSGPNTTFSSTILGRKDPVAKEEISCGFPDGPTCKSLGKNADGLEEFADPDGYCLFPLRCGNGDGGNPCIRVSA